MTRRPSTVTTWTSTNGTTFASFGAPISVTQYLGQPGGLPRRRVRQARRRGQRHGAVRRVQRRRRAPPTRRRAGDDCGGAAGCARRSTSSTAPRSTPKWEVVNPTPANLAVAGGKLALTTAQGDVSGANFTARNILLQDVPQRPVDGDHEARPHGDRPERPVAGGLVVYGSKDPNYFAKIGVQYKTNDLSGQPMNGIWAERVLTVNGDHHAARTAASTRTPASSPRRPAICGCGRATTART